MIPNPDRKERKKESARAHIVQAARQLFLKRATTDSLSLRQVAQQAECAPATIYLYFKNRTDLISTLYDQAFALLSSYAMPVLMEGSGISRLRRVGEVMRRFAYEHPQDFVLIFQTPNKAASMEEYIASATPVKKLIEVIGEDAARGELRLLEGMDALGTAYAFWGFVFGMVDMRIVHLKDVQGDFETIQQSALENFLKLLDPQNKS